MFLLTESQKKNQPKYIDFIITLFGNSIRYFSSKWYKEFPWLHYNLDKDAAICYTCMSAEIKGLKAICHNNDEAFITHGYKNWHHATENFKVHEESNCHKDYVNQLSPPERVCYVDETFDEKLICEITRNRKIFLTILRNIQFLYRQDLVFEITEIECRDLELLIGWRKNEKSTFIMTRKMKS